jgi:hypothetical protein
MASLTNILGVARTSGGVNVPIRVGGTGIIDGSGEPATPGTPHPMKQLYGRTSGGVNLPVLCTSDGKLHIAW